MSISKRLSEVLNSGQSRTVLLTGNIYDLFWSSRRSEYVPLMEFLKSLCHVEPTETSRGMTLVTYEINRHVEIIGDSKELEAAWDEHIRSGMQLSSRCDQTKSNPTFALELLRQLAEAARVAKISNRITFIIEGIDIIVPDEPIPRMQAADRQRMCILQDWVSDPDFSCGPNNLILTAESRSLVHNRVSRLHEVIEVEIGSPDRSARSEFIERSNVEPPCDDFVALTAGLPLHCVRRLLDLKANRNDVLASVEEFVKSQLGEQTVEFKKPNHDLNDVIGFGNVKSFIRNYMLPRFDGGPDSIAGAAFGGPIGGGKSFLGEALAGELGIPVLVLKSIRSKWFGETDVIFERLKRILTALDRVVIFVDEADTQFSDLSGETHSTEARLTGNIQAMMSDPSLRGRVLWLLMTARIHRLSPDIRRPGRVGDLIVPILDPEEQDQSIFREWVFDGLNHDCCHPHDETIITLTAGFSASSYASLRSEIRSSGISAMSEAVAILEDLLPGNIESTRRYQTLQALLNCSRLSLLPSDCRSRSDYVSKRKEWLDEARELELSGLV